MSKFTDRLWLELKREHGAELAQMEGPVESHNRRARPRVLVGTGAGLAGVGTAVALALAAAGSSPAFAVTRNPDGTISVVINRLEGIQGANQRLHAIGVRAVAVPVNADCKNGPVAQAALQALKYRARPGSWSIDKAARPGVIHAEINPGRIPNGKTLVLAAPPPGARVAIAKARAVAGAVPDCYAYDAPVAAGAAACIAGPIAVSPGDGGGSGTSTTGTTGTDTTGTDTAGTDTTGPATAGTGTTGTGTTGTGTTGGGAPPSRQLVPCLPPPQCAVGEVTTAPASSAKRARTAKRAPTAKPAGSAKH
jgi:hypothetical protein